MILDYWYFGPYGLLIEWIIAYRDYVYSRLLGFCGLWELGSCGFCGLWVQWLIGIMYTVACGDYGYEEYLDNIDSLRVNSGLWGLSGLLVFWSIYVYSEVQGLCALWVLWTVWIIDTMDYSL